MFPLQSHSDFLNDNYEQIIKKAAEQMSYLFKRMTLDDRESHNTL